MDSSCSVTTVSDEVSAATVTSDPAIVPRMVCAEVGLMNSSGNTPASLTSESTVTSAAISAGPSSRNATVVNQNPANSSGNDRRSARS